ncbi:hypothetical protein E3J74_05550 [Candidatus Bathyarchaeota archaeon]|nr:MAG: hypothetical protein E3J74_05550 [Candidatus Bathyarchaeota archaeon]
MLIKYLSTFKHHWSRGVFSEVLLNRVVKADYDWEDLQRLVRRGSLPSQEDVLKAVLKNYVFLKDLNGLLLRIVGDSKAHGENELVARLLSDLRVRFSALVSL